MSDVEETSGGTEQNVEENETSVEEQHADTAVTEDATEANATQDDVTDGGEIDEAGASEDEAPAVPEEEKNPGLEEAPVPNEDEAEPNEDEAEPNEDEAEPNEDEVVPDEEKNPGLEEAPVPNEDEAVPDEEKNPGLEEAPAPNEDESTRITLTEENASQMKDSPSSTTGKIPYLEEGNEPNDENTEEVSALTEDVFGPTEKMSAPAEKVSAPAEEVFVPTEKESAPTEKVSAPVEAATTSPRPEAQEDPGSRIHPAPQVENEEERVELPPLIVNAQPPPIGSPPLVKDIDDHVPQPGMDMSAQTKSDMPESQAPDDATATVKLLLMPSGQTVTKTLKLRVTFGEVIEILGKDLRMPPDVLEMLFNGKIVQHNFCLEDYGIEANGTVAFEVNSKDPLTYPMREFVPREPLGGMADVITVRIQMDDNNCRDIVVEIERTGTKKPFLGGYRHKRSGTVYHHAAIQTNPKVRNVPVVERYSRDTQTWEGRHRVQQTFNTTSTQMTKPGVFVTNATDKLIIPTGYETADDYKARILAKVIVLQRYLRGWLAKRYVSKLREDKLKREDYDRMEELRKRQDKEERVRKDFQRRMNPKSKEDFDLLYSALEKWRQEELARINSTMRGAERKAALYLLLEQETELIAAIDRHHLDANAENKDKGIQRLLSKAAASKKWRNQEGKLLEIDTPYTLRGKELLDIYNSLNMKYLTQDERLDVLLTLKHTVKEHDCKLTQEIVELIDREADLLMRGVKEDNLAGLRKRITTLFLQYCKTPLFNPEMARLLKVPQDPSVLRQDIHFCVSCGRYLQSTEFSLGIKSTGIGRCRRCLRQDNLARTREDQSAYKYLLQDLRRREETFHDNDRIAFLIEEDDVRYLVDNIWEGMSILSSWNDLADLELVRWDYAAEWSPWNTALLTKDEAEAHRKLVDLEQAYGSILVHRVKQKHVLAKNYFHKLKHMVEKMRIMELELENVRQTTK